MKKEKKEYRYLTLLVRGCILSLKSETFKDGVEL